MEQHLILVTSIAPLTHTWLHGLVWTSQWRFMVSWLAPCTDTTLPMSSICPCRVGIDMHTSPWPEYQAPDTLKCTHAHMRVRTHASYSIWSAHLIVSYLLLTTIQSDMAATYYMKRRVMVMCVQSHHKWTADIHCPHCSPRLHPHITHTDCFVMLRCRSESVTRATRPGALTSRWCRRSYTMRYYAFCSLIPGVYILCVCVCVCVCGDTRSVSSARCHSERLCSWPLPQLICLLLPELSRPRHACVCLSVYLSMCTVPHNVFLCPSLSACVCVCVVHVWAHHVIFHSLPTGIRPFISRSPCVGVTHSANEERMEQGRAGERGGKK